MHVLLKSLSVLVVDDDPHIRELIKEILVTQVQEIETAENGVLALEIASKKHFGLIITDINMPELNGPNLARALRESKSTVPIIFMSGMEISALIGALNNRFNSLFLKKPFRPSALIDVMVATLLQAKQA